LASYHANEEVLRNNYQEEMKSILENNDRMLNEILDRAYHSATERINSTRFYFQWNFEKYSFQIVKEELKSELGVKINCDAVIEEATELYVLNKIRPRSNKLISLWTVTIILLVILTIIIIVIIDYYFRMPNKTNNVKQKIQ